MKKIMIIDDSKLHQKKIKDIISDLGYEVSGVFTYGEKAVDYIIKERNQPDLIIIDIILAGKMNGYQAAKKISSETNIPFIFLAVKKDDIEELEASVYLNKPFSKQELKNSIELALYKYDDYKKTQEKNEEQEMILDTIGTQIWYLNDPETYGNVNQAHADFMGLDKSDIENKKMIAFLDEEEAESYSLGNIKVFSEKKKIKTEEWLKNSSDEKRLIAITRNPKLTEDGEVEYVVCSGEDITERKRNEEKLKMEKENLKTTLNSIGDAVISTDIDGRIVRMNPVAEGLTGWDRENAIGNPIEKVFNIVNAKTRNKVENLVDKVLEEKKVDNHTVLIAKDRTEYQIAYSSAPIINDQDNITGVVLVFRDVTEKYEMRQKIIEQKNFLSSILETQSGLVVVMNKKGEIVRFNKACEELTGFTFEEVKNKKIWKILIKKNEIEETKKIFRNLKEKNFPNEHENYWKTKSKELRLISWSNNVILDQNNEVKYIIGTGNDITEKLLREEILKRSQQIANVGSWVLSLKKNKLFWSDEIYRIFGMNPQEFEATYEAFLATIHPDDREKVNNAYTTSIENNEDSYEIEHRIIKHDNGEIRYVNEKCEHIKNDDVIIRSLGIVQDITDRKEKEEQIQNQKQRLENIIEGADVGTWEWNVQTGEIIFNEKCAEIIGYTLEEISPTTFENTRKFFHPKNLEKSSKMFEEHFNGEIDQYKTEIRMEHKGGHWVWVQTQGKVITWTEEGEPEWVYGTHQNINKRKQAEDQLHYKTFHDELTGLYNRAYFNEEVKRFDNKRQLPLSVIICDVNGLKITNDTFGHKQGDKILKIIAQILKNSCRQEDMIARTGGDEFVILLPQTSKEETKEIYTRIKEACQRSKKDPIKPSIALGIATKKNMTDDFEKVLKKAEDKMYQNKFYESKSVHNTIIDSLETMLRETSNETLEHSQRLRNLGVDLGKKLDLSQHELDVLVSLTNLHDLGKIAISKDILQKPGPLTDKEWEEIKKHPEAGYKIANSSPKLYEVAEGILTHHERWDGDGYPQGLKEEEIPLLARIITIVDAYDVMTNSRPYKKAISKEDALKEIERCSGSHFDPELAAIFVDMMKTLDSIED